MVCKSNIYCEIKSINNKLNNNQLKFQSQFLSYLKKEETRNIKNGAWVEGDHLGKLK